MVQSFFCNSRYYYSIIKWYTISVISGSFSLFMHGCWRKPIRSSANDEHISHDGHTQKSKLQYICSVEVDRKCLAGRKVVTYCERRTSDETICMRLLGIRAESAVEISFIVRLTHGRPVSKLVPIQSIYSDSIYLSYSQFSLGERYWVARTCFVSLRRSCFISTKNKAIRASCNLIRCSSTLVWHRISNDYCKFK